MTDVSIIINGVRYDTVTDNSNPVFDYCIDCDLITMCKTHCNSNLCEQLGIGLNYCFKESNKSFER